MLQNTLPTAALSSPIVKAVLVVIGAAVLYVLWLELRKIPAKLFVLMAIAFVDMVGLLMVIPLLPFYAQRLGAGGTVVGLLVSSFSVAQLLSAPVWGRMSDRFGRRPALLVALGASAIAYVIFGYANSLWLLFLSRIVQGAGGGTVGVIQAYVADATEPKDRARSLGWLSAATNLGVTLGPVLGALAVTMGAKHLHAGTLCFTIGPAAPGLLAAALIGLTMLFAWKYLREARQTHEVAEHAAKAAVSSGAAALRVLEHPGEAASRLIWIYGIAIGAFQGVNAILALFLAYRWNVTEKTIAYFFTYIGAISVLTRVLLLGKAVDRFGEARLSRIGTVLLAAGLAAIPLANSIPMLGLAVALIPLGTAFTFPCVTALLSRVIGSHERGLYMGLQQTFGGVARVLFPVVMGVVYDRLGKGVPFWIAATLVIGTLMLGFGLDERVARQRSPA
jgi:MFS family permease